MAFARIPVPARLSLAAGVLLLGAALVRALAMGDPLLAGLLAAAGMALAFAGHALLASSASEPAEPRESWEAASPQPILAAADPAPASLAFLSDPFAIPPPVLADMQAVQPFGKRCAARSRAFSTTWPKAWLR